MATITNLNIPILKQELNVSLRTENYAYVQSAIESRLNVPHSADIRTSLIQASKVVAANTAENYAEKTMWTDAAKETFVKLVSAATAYVVCDKLGFDTIDLEMEYNSLNAYEAMNDAVSKAANSISATVLRSVQRNISNSNMLIERNNENERNSVNESNSGSAVNDNANGERSVRDMELSRGQQGVEGDGGDRKKSITVSGTSREQKDKISGMERAAHIGDSNRQIRNNEKHISEKVSAGNIQQHGSERNADSTSGSNSGEHGTRDEGLHSQSGTDGQSVRRSSTEPGLRRESQDIRNASAASGGSNDKNVDPLGRDDVIGNIEYRFIRDKKYVKGETGTMLKVAERLEAENISFSGKLNGDSITLTVSGPELRDKVKNYLEEIKPPEKENSPVGNSKALQYAKKINKNKYDDNKYASMVLDYLSNNLESSDLIKLGSTPLSLQITGAADKDMVITQATFQNSINPENIRSHGHTSGHDIPIDIMSNLPEILRKPIMIIQGSKENSVLVVTDAVNLNGKNVVIPVSFDKKLGFYLVNSIDSVYPKESLRNYIDNAINNNRVLAQNKEKAKNLLRSIGCQSSKENTVISFDNSIAYTTDNVKYPYNNSIDKNSNNILVQENSPLGNSDKLLNVDSFAAQVNDAISGILDKYNALKVCDTPDLLIQAGCEQLPMLYTQNHLMEALHEKSPSNPHWHGLTVEQITSVPDLLKEPVMLFDSISPKNSENSIVAVLNAIDNDKLPLTVNIKANGNGTYELEKIPSNFITSIYGKDNFDNYISRVVEKKALIFWNKEKSQELFGVSGLQLPGCLNNLDSNIIIHKSNNIVNANTENNLTTNVSISNNEYNLESDLTKIIKNETEVENIQNLSETNAKLITNDSDNIVVDGHYGTWYVIDKEIINDKQLFLLESEDYGEDVAALIVDENVNVVLDEVYNGFLDYHETFDDKLIDNSPVGNLDEKDFSADIIYNYAANHMPEIIRHMNATDEMDDMTEIFTDSEEKRIEIAKKHIMNENIPTEVFNLYPDKNLIINVHKNDEGVKVFNGNNEIHFSWKQVAEFCVTAAENWTNSEDDRAYKYLESKYTYERIQAAIEAKTGIYLVNDENNEVRYLYDRDKDSYARDNGKDSDEITIYKGQEIDSISMWLQTDGYRVLGYSSSEITKYPDVSLSRDEFIGFVSNELSGRKYIQSAQADETKFRFLIHSGITDMLYNLITEDEHIGNYTPKEMEKLFDLINNDFFERESLYNVIF